MTGAVLAALHRATDAIDGERIGPPATLFAVGIAGTLGAASLFRAPVTTLIVIIIGVAGVRLTFLPLGYSGPRPSVFRLLHWVLVSLSAAAYRVLVWLGATAVLTLLWAGLADPGDLPYTALFTAAFSYALTTTGLLLQASALCCLVLLIGSPRPRTLRPMDYVTFPARTPVRAASAVRALARLEDPAADVTAAGALDWLGDPGARAAAQEVLSGPISPEGRR